MPHQDAPPPLVTGPPVDQARVDAAYWHERGARCMAARRAMTHLSPEGEGILVRRRRGILVGQEGRPGEA